MRLDENKLEALRRWGVELRQAGVEEYAAAGRAILLLIEEVERLEDELRQERGRPSDVPPVPSDEADEDSEDPVASRLHERLQRVLGRASSSPAASDSAASSPQAWIESLRRQK